MKLLVTFLLVFLCAVSSAQVSEYLNFNDSVSFTYPILIDLDYGYSFDDSSFISMNEDYRIIMLNDILDYEKECYNDSVSYRDLVFENKQYVVKDIWIHREPTFKGFIEFLKKK